VRYASILSATALLVRAHAVEAADPLCKELEAFAAAQLSEKGDPIPRYWVEFHWGFAPDPNTFWSWGCRHSDDAAATRLCDWLMENISREFRSSLPIGVQKCMGYKFPRNAISDWNISEGIISLPARDGSWLILEISSLGMPSGESAVRISLESVDRKFDPDELPPMESFASLADSLGSGE